MTGQVVILGWCLLKEWLVKGIENGHSLADPKRFTGLRW